jgi:hypothetical protein
MSLRSQWKIVLLVIAVIAAGLGSPKPVLAQINGIWWYCGANGSDKYDPTITLINLTDVPLNATYNNVVVDGWQYAVVPFEYFGVGGEDAAPLVSVPPYRTVIWKAMAEGIPGGSHIHYSGKITFLPQGMDPKWSVDLNFTVDSAYGLATGNGTWLYLTPTHTDNTQWIDTWSANNQVDKPFYREGGTPPVYATPLKDGKMHNQMNLLGWDLVVSLYSSSNQRVVLVVRQTHGHKGEPGVADTDPDVYQGWLLDWVDDDRSTVPHQ